MSKANYLNEVGSFECVVQTPEAGWFGEQGEKKTPFIRIPLVVNDPSNPRNNGQITVWKGWLSEAAFDKTIIRLKEVFGFDGDLVALHEGTVTFAGMACNVTTEMETYQGKSMCKVAWLNPPGGGGVKPLAEEKVNSLLSKLSARGKALAKSVQGPAVAPAAPTATTSRNTSPSTTPPTQKPLSGSPEDDTDVPFN